MPDRLSIFIIIPAIAAAVISFAANAFFKALNACNMAEWEKAAEDGDKKAAKICAYSDKANRCEFTGAYLNALHFLLQGGLVIWTGNSLLKSTLLPAALTRNLALTILFLLVAAFVYLCIAAAVTVILPVRLAARHADGFVKVLSGPADVLYVLCGPAVSAMIGISNAIMAMFGDLEHKVEEDVTEDEIISMVNEGHEAGVLLESEAKMINNIFEFGDKEVQDIMTHRNQVFAIPSDMTLEEAVNSMLEEKYSRYPVYDETLDHIIGVLYMKDALRAQASGQDMSVILGKCGDLLRKPFFVPQTKKIDQLFHIMKIKKLQLAIVVDEYGQTDGIVAMEDILEEIVGNILDEYDEEGNFIEKTGTDEYILEGLTPLEELEERFDLHFKDEPFETLNGFLISRLEHIPEDNEKFSCEYEGFYFEVLSVENKVIQSVLLKKCAVHHVEPE